MAQNFYLKSNEFKNNEAIPSKCTCDGIGHSPSLIWKNAPQNTKSFVLIMDDPEAISGNFVHWVLFDIPKNIHKLEYNIKKLPDKTLRGSTSNTKCLKNINHLDYLGPCPPDKMHHYYFKLYAIDMPSLELKEGASKKDIENAMKDHIVGTAKLIGTYQRLLK